MAAPLRERISIATDEIAQDLGEVREFLQKHRLKAIDLRVVGGERVPAISKKDYETLKAWVRSGEVEVVGFSPGLFKAPIEDAAKHLKDLLPRSLEMALELKARLMVSFAFLGEKADLDAFRKAADACARAGLPLLVENEPGTPARTAPETLRLLDTVAHPNLFSLWDPANTDEPTKVGEGLRLLFPHVRHIHVKNGGPLKNGPIDWKAHLALLERLEYGGYLGIETHYLPFKEGSETVLGELREFLA